MVRFCFECEHEEEIQTFLGETGICVNCGSDDTVVTEDDGEIATVSCTDWYGEDFEA